VLVVLLVTPFAAYGQDEQGHLSPDHPMQFYWFRTERQAEPRVIATMDSRVQQIAEAFGRGDFALARSLAQGLLESTGIGPDLRADAVAMLIEIFLAEGNFDSARKTAQREGDAEAIARVNGMEASYEATVGRLQQIAATTTDPDAAARAELATAQAHRSAGRNELALEAYERVVRRHPSSLYAALAFRHLVSQQWEAGDRDGAIAACERAIDMAPDYPLGVMACRLLFQFPMAGNEAAREAMRVRLKTIATRHPGTQVADTARFGIGRLYESDGIPEMAEREWAELMVERHGSPVLPTVQASLLKLRYELGIEASDQQDYAQAVRWLAPMVSDPWFAGRNHWIDTPESEAAVSVAKQQAAVFRLAQAYQHLEEWDKAAEAFRLIAVPNCGEYEGALYPLAESLYEAKRWDEAREVAAELIAHFPDSDLV